MTTEPKHGKCCICGERERILGRVMCKECFAEIVLTEGDAGVKAVEELHKVHDGSTTVSVEIGGGPGTPALAKAIKCEGCGKSSLYRPETKKGGYFCDECGKQLCPSCAAYCSHKDWNYQNKILCKNCRAEKSLTGQPVDEVEGSLPGQETTAPKREPKPHCGRATCIEDPRDAEWDKTHPHPTTGKIEYSPFCVCQCPKCREAVASGFMEPMFGKMTPDPDPEPEAKKKTRRMAPRPPKMTAEERAEWEAYRREAEQA